MVLEIAFRLVSKTAARLNFRKALQVLGGTLVVLLLNLPAHSQGSAGRILGTITDSNGGAIAGATVTVLDVQRGTTRTLTTEDTGAYNAPNLLPGAYKVRADFKGFKIIERQNIVLEVGQEVRVDLALQPGDQEQTITVTESIPLVETTNAELGGTISNEIINDIPLNGRNFENLLQLRPGVTIYPGGSGWAQSTNGIRAHDNTYMVEGIASSDPWMAQSVMNAVMAAGDAGTILPIDAIDEFKTQQNPRAEYGWKPGSVVNVGIKSGTNSYHGTAYAYGRTTGFGARDYFNPAPNLKTPVQLEQFGGTFGGPIKKDKLFFFVNTEDQRYSVGNPASHTVPFTCGGGSAGCGLTVPSATTSLVDACKGALGNANFSQLSARMAGLDPATCDPVSSLTVNGFQGLFPVNNGPSQTIGTSINTVNHINSGMAKVDYHVSEKHSLSGMYFISPGRGVVVDAPGTQVAPQWLTNQYARSQVTSGSWTWVPNSRWVNEARVGYSHYYQAFKSQDASNNPATYTFNGNTYAINTGQTNPAYYGLPTINFTGFGFSMGAGWPKTVGPDGVSEILDHISYLRGNHAFKFGGEIVMNQSTTNVTANTKGPLTFGSSVSNTLPNFFIGLPDSANFLTGNLLRHMSSNQFALFLQDDWRVTPRFMLNLGVRYEVDGVLKERDNLIGNFDPSKGLVQVGFGILSPYNGDHNNFSPRLGFAWDVRGNGKTVVRAGASIIYEALSMDVFNGIGNFLGLRSVPTGNTIFVNGVQQPTPGSIGILSITEDPAMVQANWVNNSPARALYSNTPACGDSALGDPGPCNTLSVDRNLRSPYVSTWNFGIQRAITNNLSVDVEYVGNHGTKLLGMTDLNQPDLVTLTGVGNGVGTITTGPGWTATALANCAVNPKACKTSSKAERLARPFTTACTSGSAGCFPYLAYVDGLSNLDHSTYNGLQVSLTQRPSHGLSYNFGYTFSHSLDNNSDNWGNGLRIPINNANPAASLYGSSNFDIRQRGTFSVTYAIPGLKSPVQLLQGWSLNSVVIFQTGSPWSIRDNSTDFSGTAERSNPGGTQGEQWDFFGNPTDFTPVHGWTNTNPDISGAFQGGAPYFSGTTDAACLARATPMGPLAVSSLTNKGCYRVGTSMLLPPPYGSYGTTGRNIFRGPRFSNIDLSVTKETKIKERLTVQFRAEFFNVLNHVNFANPFGGPGGSASNINPSAGPGTFGFPGATPDTLSSNPVLGSGGPRAMQLGLKLLF
jgi:hypothetical protein